MKSHDARAGDDDIRRAIEELAERLPGSISALSAIAYDYRWSWHPEGPALFRDIDPDAWRRGGQNARWMIEAVPPHRLEALASNAYYVERVRRVATALENDRLRPSASDTLRASHPVAYFCSEFGGHPSLPLYGGGLGVLAGDLVKAASDLALPLLCMSLFYREGYFRQRLDPSGWQIEYWTPTVIERLPAVLVTDGTERPLTVSLEIRGRLVHVQAWRVDFGRVPVYLLDTDREDNHPIDRWITDRLYVADRRTRLAQYAVLGCGGVRMLEAMGIEPHLVHLNEGHAALGAFERIGALLRRGMLCDEAIAAVRARTVFTTHTPVAAGNEWFDAVEVEPVLGALPRALGVPADVFYGLGRFHPENDSEPVALTPLALRTSRASNAVSRRHGEVSREMWQGLWPDRSVAEIPIGHVTNGIHTTTWMAPEMQSLLDAHLPADWRARTSDPSCFDAIDAIPDAALWATRRALRARLVEEASERCIPMRLARNEPPEYVDAAMRISDPDALTIGFARRVATYKRLHLLTMHLDRGLRLIGDPQRPVQIVIAGKAHPADDDAKRTLQSLLRVRGGPNVASRIVFLEDYDLSIAPLVVAGVDVWLNLPRPPFEASGTSGMKVVANGGLNLSVLDGWWSEAFDGENGWGIATPAGGPEAQDHADAATLFDLIENEVVPLFYARNAEGVPEGWLRRVKASMRGLVPRFSAERMLRDYARDLYAAELPVAAAASRPAPSARRRS